MFKQAIPFVDEGKSSEVQQRKDVGMWRLERFFQYAFSIL
jgi:hypothetical protein